jgi:hypothetical protein
MLSITQVVVNNSEPTLVFSGTGKVKLSANNVFYARGEDSDAGEYFAVGNSGIEFQFDCPTEIWGIIQAGASTTSNCKVIHWY